MKLTEAQRRALTIVKMHAPIGGSRFGYMMWPQMKQGFGRKAQAAGFAGGGFLAKLATKGLVRHAYTEAYCTEYRITEAGRTALEEQT